MCGKSVGTSSLSVNFKQAFVNRTMIIGQIGAYHPPRVQLGVFMTQGDIFFELLEVHLRSLVRGAELFE